MILGSHVIFSAYGFWLPNDPRGSWSDFVGSWELFRYGRATRIDARHSVAHVEHDQSLRQAAKRALKYPPVQFSGIQAHAVSHGFAEYARKSKLLIWACAIMPDHVHIVLGRHRLSVEQLVIQLKGEATDRLNEEGIHPFPVPFGKQPKCLARGEWKVYLDCEDDIFHAICYVEENPTKEGLRRQRWKFVTSYV